MSSEVFIRDSAIVVPPGFSRPAHFDAHGIPQGVIHELDGKPLSRAFRLLELLPHPPRAPLFLATTVGAIDLLEQGKKLDCCKELYRYALDRFGLEEGGIVSGACASGQLAVALAAEYVASGRSEQAVVLGCDISSEFVTSGFASLGALSASGVCRPYDDARDGLLLGEAAGWILVSSQRARCRIAGWGQSADAGHATAPDCSGRYLAMAGSRALAMAGRNPGEVGLIAGHGTGTRYNDAAELAAFGRIFGDNLPPLFSVKKEYGHTLGATGVLQVIAAAGRGPGISMSFNAGFGGVNSAIVLEAAT